LQAVFGFLDGRDVPGGHPPQHGDRLVELHEPLAALPHDLDVRGLEDEVGELLEGFPDGHVDEDGVVAKGTERRGVAGVVLEAPHEARCGVGDRVDRLERLTEPSDRLGFEWSDQRADVQLSKLPGPLAHELSVDPQG